VFRCTSRLLRESESFLLRLKYINIRQHRTQAPTNIPTPIPIAIHAPELKLTFDGVVKVDVDSASPAFPVEATLAVVFVVASTLATKFQPLTGTAETVCLVKYDVVIHDSMEPVFENICKNLLCKYCRPALIGTWWVLCCI